MQKRKKVTEAFLRLALPPPPPPLKLTLTPQTTMDKSAFKIHKKFKQHSINIKNYTAHPHDLVHVPAKFRENTFLSYSAKTKRDGQTDGWTDGRTERQTDRRGRCNISRPRAYVLAGDKEQNLTLKNDL